MTARPVGGDTREALREEIVRVYRTWPGDTSFTAELFADAVLALPAVRAALDAQEKAEEAERRGYERGKRETAEYLLRVSEAARARAGDR